MHLNLEPVRFSFSVYIIHYTFLKYKFKQGIMKKHSCLILALIALAVTSVYSQDNDKKASREEKKVEQQAQMEKLVTSKTFVFVGVTAYPLGQVPVDLGSNTNSVTFTPELIQSDMPFYGTGYSGMAMGRDTGMRFSGKPEDFTVVKGEKGYEINMGVRGETDMYTISVVVGFEGSATLTISSIDRSTISYQGEIVQ